MLLTRDPCHIHQVFNHLLVARDDIEWTNQGMGHCINQLYNSDQTEGVESRLICIYPICSVLDLGKAKGKGKRKG